MKRLPCMKPPAAACACAAATDQQLVALLSAVFPTVIPSFTTHISYQSHVILLSSRSIVEDAARYMQDDMATPAAQRPPKRHRLRPQSASQPDSGGLDAAVIAQMARRRQEKYGGCCPAAKHCAQRGGPQTVPQASPPSAHQTPQQRKQPSHRPVHTVVLQVIRASLF